jgi:hypothetical protein
MQVETLYYSLLKPFVPHSFKFSFILFTPLPHTLKVVI